MKLKSGKAMYSGRFDQYGLTGQQLEQLHNTLFSMLLDIKKICEDNHIAYSGMEVLFPGMTMRM